MNVSSCILLQPNRRYSIKKSPKFELYYIPKNKYIEGDVRYCCLKLLTTKLLMFVLYKLSKPPLLNQKVKFIRTPISLIGKNNLLSNKKYVVQFLYILKTTKNQLLLWLSVFFSYNKK